MPIQIIFECVQSRLLGHKHLVFLKLLQGFDLTGSAALYGTNALHRRLSRRQGSHVAELVLDSRLADVTVVRRRLLAHRGVNNLSLIHISRLE